jgi:hypothetical protein
MPEASEQSRGFASPHRAPARAPAVKGRLAGLLWMGGGAAPLCLCLAFVLHFHGGDDPAAQACDTTLSALLQAIQAEPVPSVTPAWPRRCGIPPWA